MISRRTALIKEATKLWPYLNGVINVYKPSGISVKKVQASIISNLCRDLNELQVRPPRNRISIEAGSNDNYVVKCETDLSDHELVVGERYQPCDIRCSASSFLGKFSSGVMILGVNNGTKTAFKLRENRPIRCYHVTGRFGRSTETHFSDSPVTTRATFSHVYKEKLNSLLASMQASHQKKMFDLCGVDIQSQTAYEMAISGPLRPAQSNIPLIYGLRCIEFGKSYFTIELHATNESEAYLGILIHEIGLHLKTVAHCTKIRCIRESHFTLNDSLLKRHWNIEAILANMNRCQNIIIAEHSEKQVDFVLREKEN